MTTPGPTDAGGASSRRPRPRRRRLQRTRYRAAVQQFLNLPGHNGRASIFALVEDTSRLDKTELRYKRLPRIELTISDCTRECALEFDIGSPEDQENSLYKVDVLIAGLDAFREGLFEEIELFNERLRTIWSGR